MKPANFLLCLVAIGISPVLGLPENYGRIVNGVAATNDEAPYIVLIQHADGTYCGGSLLSPDYVLTAGHCVNNKPVDGFIIIAAITSVYDDGIRRKVSNFTVHPNYDVTKNDVAVMQLNEPIVNAPTATVCKVPPKEGDHLDVFGWGRLAMNKRGSTTLQTISVPVRSKKDCEIEYDSIPNMFCASGLDNKSACLGDSGGPAVLKKRLCGLDETSACEGDSPEFEYQLCGLVSFAVSCGEVGYSQGYTDVRAVKSFIEDCTGLNFA